MTIIQQCKSCKKEFSGRADRRTCSPECANKEREKRGVFFVQKFFPTLGARPKSILDRVKATQWKITDERVIDYAGSPTGKAYVGIAKAPLQLAEGFGYKGVLLQTDNREFVQCHECGKWMAAVGGNHVLSHSMTMDEYKDKHGFLKNYALISDSLSYKLSENTHKRHLKLGINNSGLFTAESSKKVSANAQKARKARNLVENVQHSNRHGFCEQQLGFRLVEYIKKYKNLPSRSVKGEGLSLTVALKRRHGTINAGFKHYGLPERTSKGGIVEYTAQDGATTRINYRSMYNLENLYHWMVEHSVALQGNVNLFAQKDLPQ